MENFSVNHLKSLTQVWRNIFLYQLVKIRRIQHRNKLKKTFVGVSSHKAFPYSYSGGLYTTKFMNGLKEGKLLASECLHCGTKQVPCRMICGKCLKKMEKIIELPGTGKIVAYTQVSFPFIDPFTGKNRPVPYCYALIALDGTDNSYQGLLDIRYHHQLKSGDRVRVVFNKKRTGNLEDIKYFKVL